MSEIHGKSTAHGHLAGLRPDFLMAHGVASTPEMAEPPDLPGFEIERLLGRGGMGVVYLARQVGLDRMVAIKQTSGNLGSDPQFLERLEREAQTMGRLRHPNVVTVHQFELLLDGSAAIIMGYIEGGNLRDRLDACPDGLPVDECLRLFRETAGALSAAHAAGVVHRDLKPENILLDSDGSARITDFGLALPLDQSSPRLTLTGTTVGTIDYLAPERFQSNDPDARSDIYALGVVLYEMLTGKLPRGSFDPPQRIRKGLPKYLSDATMRALRAEPAARFQTMADFAAALDDRNAHIFRRGILVATMATAVIALGIWQPWKSTENSTWPNPESPVPFQAPGEWKDALRNVDIGRGSISGDWQKIGDAVISNNGVCILALSKNLPESYDVRTTFTRLSGKHSVAVFVTVNGGIGSVDIDGWDAGLSGFQGYENSDLRSGGSFHFPLSNGQRHDMLVEVRGGEVAIFIDGEEKSRSNIGRSTPHIVLPWAWNPTERTGILAIGSFQSPTRFENIAWREVGNGEAH
jgi:serine/threonine protein kinase